MILTLNIYSDFELHFWLDENLKQKTVFLLQLNGFAKGDFLRLDDVALGKGVVLKSAVLYHKAVFSDNFLTHFCGPAAAPLCHWLFS